MGSASSSCKFTESVTQPIQKVNEPVIIQPIQKVAIKLPNDSVYIGEYADGKLTLLNGDVFEGQVDDNNVGTGKMICGKKNIYDGMWRDNFRCGTGKIIYTNGDIFEGEWKNKCRIEGKLTCQNDDYFEGKWNSGEAFIEGKCKVVTYATNIGDPDATYEGEIINKKRNGKGKMIFKTGGVYEGQWKDGAFDGKGKLIYQSGDIYEGEFKCGLRSGFGTHVFTNGTIFQGIWKNNFHINGKSTYKNGDVYIGTWKKNKRHGKGKMIYKNKGEFNGDWIYDERECGTITLSDNTIINSSFINNVSSGYAKIIYPDQKIYYGETHDKVPHGIGKMIDSDGKTQSGMWENGLFISHDFVSPQCTICKNYYEANQLKISCGYCPNKMCTTCYANHYSEIKKGDIFPMSKMCCPFCRKVSRYVKFEDENGDVIRDESFGNYGQCNNCLKYEKIEKEVCDTENHRYPNGYTCSKCFIKESTKMCPSCKSNIEKNGGCNHITCRCKFEFCYICLVNWKNIIDGELHNRGQCMSK